ncbi:MAG: hypothetical protein CL759_07730 [Chloroflexi bacterium]|nr:hypothetical protein [Chloroflexota bacterium]
MGSDKTTLPFRGTTLVDAVAGVLAPMFRRVLVIAREPVLVTSANAEILTDDRPLHGPLVGWLGAWPTAARPGVSSPPAICLSSSRR